MLIPQQIDKYFHKQTNRLISVHKLLIDNDLIRHVFSLLSFSLEYETADKNLMQMDFEVVFK